MLEFIKSQPWWVYVLVVFLLGLMAWSVGVWIYARNLEMPEYSVSESKAGYEIRNYEPILVIQAKTNGANQEATNRGFSILAGYIFGGNQSRESIKMTAPVIDQNQSESIKMTAPVFDQAASESIKMTVPVFDKGDNQERVTTFTVPKKWTKETLPIPNDPRVKIVEWPAETKAVKRFMALSTFGQNSRSKAESALLAALKRDGVEHKGDVTFAFYDPPLTPFFLRRNEVMVTLSNE